MTPPRLARTLLSSRIRVAPTNNATNIKESATAVTSQQPCRDPTSCWSNCRCFAQVSDIEPWNRGVWFSSSIHRNNLPTPHQSDHQPPDERTLQLGKTVRTLHDRLPTLLKEPLPSDILSPSITLHLFPSTHPHLPTVSGRIAYIAALWTAPVAWGRMPLIGNVNLTILSERMVRNGGGAGVPHACREEKLIVKWKTCGKTTHRDGTGGIYRGMGLAAATDPVDKIRGFIAGMGRETSTPSAAAAPAAPAAPADPEEFCGIFIFEFDERGRLARHTIEHTDEGGDWDKMTRVVSVTDWLLGQFNGKKKEAQQPALAWCEERPSAGAIRMVDRRRA